MILLIKFSRLKSGQTFIKAYKNMKNKKKYFTKITLIKYCINTLNLKRF